MAWRKDTRTVTIEIGGSFDLADLEASALDFARTAPTKLVRHTIEAMQDDLLDVVVGVSGVPIAADDQKVAPWECTRKSCRSPQGFRRRGHRQGDRKLNAACGRLKFKLANVECLACGRRFAPMLQLLAVKPHQRRTDRVCELTAELACEVSYRKAERIAESLAGVTMSARAIRDSIVGSAPERLGPEELDVPVLLLDGTGEKAGPKKLGVELHLAIGIVGRKTVEGRISVDTVLLGATLGEPWSKMAELLADVRPGLVVVDGEEALTVLARRLWPKTPLQRCLFHLVHNLGQAAWRDNVSKPERDGLTEQMSAILDEAYESKDLEAARAAYDRLGVELEASGAWQAAGYLVGARAHAFTFLTDPNAGWLWWGHKGRPEYATGVLERVMREMNRRTDNGARWSVRGLRALLMHKLARKYDWGPFGRDESRASQVTFRLA